MRGSTTISEPEQTHEKKSLREQLKFRLKLKSEILILNDLRKR